MNAKVVFVFFFCIFAVVMAKPWIQGPALALPAEVDPEKPIMRHPDDCKIFYNFNFPMTCGEGFAFSTETLTCVPEEEADC